MRRPFALAGLIVLALGTAAAPASAQKDDPKLVARAYVTALKAREWQTVARLMDPREVRQIHDLMLPIMKKLVATRRKWPPPYEQLLAGLNGPKDVDKLRPADTFIRLLRGTLSSLRRSGGNLPGAEFSILGQVSETPTLVHVVYRARFQVRGVPFTTLSVISLTRHQNAWRVRLNENIRQMAFLFRRIARKL